HHVLDDLRARDANDRVGHVVGDGIQAALDDGEGNRIDIHAPNSRTMQPMASLWTRASGGTTMVASNSSMMSGPARGVPSTASRPTISTRMGSLPRKNETSRVPDRL